MAGQRPRRWSRQHWMNDTCLLGYNWMHVSKRDNTYYSGILYRASYTGPFRNHYTAIILSYLGQYWHGKYNQIAACMYSWYLGQYGASTGPDMVTSTGPYVALCANCMETGPVLAYWFDCIGPLLAQNAAIIGPILACYKIVCWGQMDYSEFCKTEPTNTWKYEKLYKLFRLF